MVLKEVPRGEAHRFGIAEVGGDQRLVGFEEKPAEPRGSLANLGIYVFDSDFLVKRLAALGSVTDLVSAVIQPLLDEGVPIHCEGFQGYWDDIGTIDSYFRSNMELLVPRPRFNLADPDWRIYTRSEERPPFKIQRGGRVERSLVANGAVVRGEVTDSVLFPGAVIGRGAQVTNSIIMSDTRIGPGARVDLAILDKLVEVGEGAEIGAEGGGSAPPIVEGSAHQPRSSVVVVGKQAVIPAGCRVGRRCVIDLGAGAADFGSQELQAGTTIEAGAG
jgi:glucose-1-phosphate adenylyltransferase